MTYIVSKYIKNLPTFSAKLLFKIISWNEFKNLRNKSSDFWDG